MFESAPRVILIPGIGMVNTGKNVAMSKVSGALYHRAISVMKGATTLGRFVSLNENESYNVEYWPLELYKLSLAPAEAEFSRKVVLLQVVLAELEVKRDAASFQKVRMSCLLT